MKQAIDTWQRILAGRVSMTCRKCGYDDEEERAEVTAKVRDVQQLIHRVFKHNSGGGYLHSAISDGNLECIPDAQEIRDWHKGKARPAQIKAEIKCAEALSSMSFEEREAAYDLYHGHITDDGYRTS